MIQNTFHMKLLTFCLASFGILFSACGPTPNPTMNKAIVAFWDEVEHMKQRGDTCDLIERVGLDFIEDSLIHRGEYFYGPDFIISTDEDLALWCTFCLISYDRPRKSDLFFAKGRRYGITTTHSYNPRIFIFNNAASNNSNSYVRFDAFEGDQMFAVDSAKGIIMQRIGPKGMEVENAVYRQWQIFHPKENAYTVDTLNFDQKETVYRFHFEETDRLVQLSNEPPEEDFQRYTTLYWHKSEGVFFEKIRTSRSPSIFYDYPIANCQQDAAHVAQLIKQILDYEGLADSLHRHFFDLEVEKSR